MQSMHSAMLLRQIWLSVCQSVQRRLVGLQVSYFFSAPPPLQNSKGNALSGGVKYTEMVRHRSIVTMEHQ